MLTPDPHDGCSAEPRWRFCRTEADGTLAVHLVCWHPDGSRSQWVQSVPAVEVRFLVEAFVDGVLRREGQGTV